MVHLLNVLAQLDDPTLTPDEFGTTPDAAADAAAATAGLAIFGGLFIFWLIVFVLGFILFIWALIDVIRRTFSNPNEKIIWILVIVLIWWLGPILYLLIGRKKGSVSAPQQ